MGEVWRGADAEGNPLAFKLLHESMVSDPATVQRFLQERAILVGLDHPGLVRVRDLVVEGTTLAIVMDLVEGGDLRELLTAYPVLPPAEVCRIGAEVAAGLAAVHAAGVVHRDIKPENILLDRRANPPAPRLTDFGIAKIAEQSGTGRSTMLVGTPRYIAPEVFDGQPSSPAADLYGLGILLYEMSCGVAPFAGDSTLAVLRQHVDYAPGRPAGVPDPLWDLISQLLAKDPAVRPDPAGRVSNQLTALAHDLAGAPPAPALTAPPPRIPIARAVHHQPTELTGAASAVPPPPAKRRWSTPALAAVTAAAVLLAGVLGWTIARVGAADPDEKVPVAASSPTSGSEPAPTTPPSSTSAETSPEASTSPPEEEPTASPSAQEPTILHGPDALHIPISGINDDTLVDLDEFVVETFGAAYDADDSIDIFYDAGGVMWRGNDASVGNGPSSQPEPETCAAQARSRAIGELDADDMRVDETALCVTTNEGNIAWMLLVEKTGDFDEDLVFETIVWANQS